MFCDLINISITTKRISTSMLRLKYPNKRQKKDVKSIKIIHN